MTINQIKAQIAADSNNIQLPVLQMVRQLDNEKKPTEWVSHWDNINRRRIVMHQDVMEELKKNPDYAGLALKFKLVVPEPKNVEVTNEDGTKKIVEVQSEPYGRWTVITPKNLEVAF